jgi:competence protein ComEA
MAKAAFKVCAGVLILACCAWAQLPEGPGKEEVERICTQCHELQRSISLHQDRGAWAGTVSKMIGLGAQGTNKDFQLIVDYLAKNFPGEPLPKVNVNTARAIEFESLLTIRKSQSAQIIAYREKHGPFRSIEDLKKVPDIDAAKLDAHKSRLVFQ